MKRPVCTALRGSQRSCMDNAPTYDSHTAQRGHERCRGKAVGSEVPQLSYTHESHAAPPQDRGVVRPGAALSLTDVSVFLSGGEEAEQKVVFSHRKMHKTNSNMQHMEGEIRDQHYRTTLKQNFHHLKT